MLPEFVGENHIASENSKFSMVGIFRPEVNPIQYIGCVLTIRNDQAEELIVVDNHEFLQNELLPDLNTYFTTGKLSKLLHEFMEEDIFLEELSELQHVILLAKAQGFFEQRPLEPDGLDIDNLLDNSDGGPIIV
jgi:hypothetical protein